MGPCSFRRSVSAWVAFTLFLGTGSGFGQGSPEPKPNVSDQPLAAEQLAVYSVILQGWGDDGKATVNLSIQTVPLQTSGPMGDEGCAKGLDLETASPGVVHRFRKQDLPQLGSGKIRLVDPQAQSGEIRKNDPSNTMRQGVSVEDAVRNAFAHGLVILSEIQLDKGHLHAIVSYGFVCGGLCGDGGTAVMEKTNGIWKVKSRCHDWIS